METAQYRNSLFLINFAKIDVQLLRMLRLTYNEGCIKYLRHIKFSEINKCTSLSTICFREKSLGDCKYQIQKYIYIYTLEVATASALCAPCIIAPPIWSTHVESRCRIVSLVWIELCSPSTVQTAFLLISSSDNVFFHWHINQK